jgi:hypothetical protein
MHSRSLCLNGTVCLFKAHIPDPYRVILLEAGFGHVIILPNQICSKQQVSQPVAVNGACHNSTGEEGTLGCGLTDCPRQLSRQNPATSKHTARFSDTIGRVTLVSIYTCKYTARRATTCSSTPRSIRWCTFDIQCPRDYAYSVMLNVYVFLHDTPNTIMQRHNT